MLRLSWLERFFGSSDMKMNAISFCETCAGTGWGPLESFLREPCAVCFGSGTSAPSIMNYNDLIPPSNSAYPFQTKGRTQPLCYYCAQPIRMTEPSAGYRQRVHFNWEHVNPSTTGNEHIRGSHWHCDPQYIRPDADRPRCHICGTQTNLHMGPCSAAGVPPFHATTMNQKEDQVERVFGRPKNI